MQTRSLSSTGVREPHSRARAAQAPPQGRRTPPPKEIRQPGHRVRRAPCSWSPLFVRIYATRCIIYSRSVFMQPYAYADSGATMALREVILTVLARGEMTGYEITKDFEAVYVHFWRASHQQVYRELARLNKDGRVTLRQVAQERRPDKKV